MQALLFRWTTHDCNIQVTGEQLFRGVVSRFHVNGDFNLGKASMKVSQHRRQPVIAGVALRAEPDYTMGIAVESENFLFRSFEIFQNAPRHLYQFLSLGRQRHSLSQSQE